jgi:hypothetical protein
MSAPQWADTESGHWVVLVNRSTQEGGSIVNRRCLPAALSFPWRADASMEWELARPKFRWKNRLELLPIHE